MDKKLSKLELAQQEAEVVANKTIQKINELGIYDQSLYTCLTIIQNLFNNIRKVPEESELKYEKLKEIQAYWKQQADKIEKEYKKSAGISTGVDITAMGVATAFGFGFTGAATNAALAWLGGATLATVAGEVLLGGLGPIGLPVILLKKEADKKRLERINALIRMRDVKSYELAIVELSERMTRIKDESSKLINAISKIATFGTDYTMMTEEQQYELGAYVNLMEASTMLLINPILGLQSKYTQHDFEQLCEDGCKSLIFVDLYLEEEIDYEVVRKYFKEHKQLVMTLANMLYKVRLDDKDREVLSKSLKKNNDFLSSVNMSKHDLSTFDLVLIDKALEYQYKASRN